jgi:hypothetical protein
MEGRSFTLSTANLYLLSFPKQALFSPQDSKNTFPSFLNFMLLALTSFHISADFLSRPYSSLSPPLSPPVRTITPANHIPLSYLEIAREEQKCPSIPPHKTRSTLSIISIPLSPTISLFGTVSTTVLSSKKSYKNFGDQ